MAKWLITIGIVLAVRRLAWPLLAQLGLGSLPGDVKLEKKGLTFYFPVTTSLIVSALIALLLWLFRRQAAGGTGRCARRTRRIALAKYRVASPISTRAGRAEGRLSLIAPT